MDCSLVGHFFLIDRSDAVQGGWVRRKGMVGGIFVLFFRRLDIFRYSLQGTYLLLVAGCWCLDRLPTYLADVLSGEM
jgi:hypothetical protein